MSRMTTLNPEKIGFMNLADTDLLVEAATGEIDLNEVARDILAKRGLDQESSSSPRAASWLMKPPRRSRGPGAKSRRTCPGAHGRGDWSTAC